MLTKQKRLTLLKISYRPKVFKWQMRDRTKMWAMDEKSKVDMYEEYVAPGGICQFAFWASLGGDVAQ